MNDYIMAQVQQMKVYVKAWETSCEFSAKKTDGIIDREEERTLKHIHKAVDRFIRELDKI